MQEKNLVELNDQDLDNVSGGCAGSEGNDPVTAAISTDAHLFPCCPNFHCGSKALQSVLDWIPEG